MSELRISENQEITEGEISKRLHLYHQTTKEKWGRMQEVGAIVSERELLRRGLITQEQLEDLETTSTGELDRAEGRDNYVFLSQIPQKYGDVTLEIDLSALNIEGTKVATAGDWLHFVDTQENRDYFRSSIIPASEFIQYLVNFMNSLPEREWFFGKRDERLENILSQGLLENARGNPEKIRLFWRLFPEIMVPKELPLSYVKQVSVEENNQSYKNESGEI